MKLSIDFVADKIFNILELNDLYHFIDISNEVWTYSRIDILIMCEWSMCVNPRTSSAHSVTRVTTMKVNPRDENP